MLNLKDIIKEQQNTGNGRTSNWVEVPSKKQLVNCTLLTKEQIETLSQLKCTFTFSVHVSGKFVVVTMYYSNTKTYSFYVVNTTTWDTVVCDSVKSSKKYVADELSKVVEENKTEETTGDTTSEETTQENTTEETK